ADDVTSKAMKKAASRAIERCDGSIVFSRSAWRRPTRSASGLPATAAVGARDDFQQVAARVLEVDAASAVVTVDLARLGLRRVSPVGVALLFDAGEDLVELGLAHEERVVLRPDLGLLVHEIDVDAVCRGDDLKGAPFLRGR